MKPRWTGAWLVVVAFVMALLPMAANAAAPAAPTPLAPTNGTTVDQPVFSWTTVADADHYEIEVALDDQFVTMTDPPLPEEPDEIINPKPVYGTTYVPTFTYSAKTHYWHIRAISRDGTESDWSPSWVFTRRWTKEDEPAGAELDTPPSRVENVGLATGGHSAALNEVAFSWDPVPGASYYQVQIGPDAEGRAMTCTTPHAVLIPPFSRYYQRRDPLDSCSGLMSPQHSWETGGGWTQPTPGQIEIATEAGAIGDQWYVRFLDRDQKAVLVAPFLTEVLSSGGDPRVVTLSGPVPADPAAVVQYFKVGIPLEAGGTYAVRVRAVDFTVTPDYPAVRKTPVYGMWSDQRPEPGEPLVPAFAFAVTGPRSGAGSPNTPVVPVDLNQTNTDVPVLAWEPVPNAIAYQVKIALDRDFTNPVAEYTTRNVTFIPPETYDDNGPSGKYYWFATPCTFDDAVSETIECNVPDREAINNPLYVGRFSKRSEPVQNLSETAIDNQTNVLLRWGDALTAARSLNPSFTPGGVEKYQVQFTDGPWSTASSVVTDNLAYSTTAIEPLERGTYRWRVRPMDGQGVPLAWASGPDFIIEAADEPSPSPTTSTSTPLPSSSPTASTGPTPIATPIPSTSRAPDPIPVYQAPAPAVDRTAEIPPGKPGKPTVKRVTSHKLRVHWRASEELEAPVTAYLIYRSTNGTKFKKVRTVNSQNTRLKAKRGRTYWFYVVADSDAGRSKAGGTSKFTMPRR